LAEHDALTKLVAQKWCMMGNNMSPSTKKIEGIYTALLNEFNGSQQHFIQAQNKKRWQLMKKIEEAREKQTRHPTTLLTYTSKLDFPDASMTMVNQWDVKAVYTILQEIPAGNDIELTVHTHGGLGTKAKQIVELIRRRGRKFRVVVPEIAKSAGTILALGADCLTLGPPSELGPIDPQVRRVIGTAAQYVPAWSYIESLNELKKDSVDAQGNLRQEYYPLLASFDYPFYKICEQTWASTRETSKELLKAGMLKGVSGQALKAEAITRFFLEDFKPHDALISHVEASQVLGSKNIEVLPEESDLWSWYWELHLRNCVLLDGTTIVKHIERKGGALHQQSQRQQ
jgi:hypothetical protein